MATVSKVKVLTGSWAGQIGEFVRQDEGVFEMVPVKREFEDEHGAKAEVTELQSVRQPGRIVLRIGSGRLIEFDPEAVEPVEDDEPKPDAE